MHGGKTLAWFAHPRFKHGRYSKVRHSGTGRKRGARSAQAGAGSCSPSTRSRSVGPRRGAVSHPKHWSELSRASSLSTPPALRRGAQPIKTGARDSLKVHTACHPPRRRAMSYSDKATSLRRCTALRSDGEPCRAWAMWDDTRQLCVHHAGRGKRGRQRGQKGSERTRFTPCTCLAYAWPHRPGGGLCRWPDPPVFRLKTPAGCHARPRLQRFELAFVRRLRARHKWGPAER